MRRIVVEGLGGHSYVEMGRGLNCDWLRLLIAVPVYSEGPFAPHPV